MILVMAEKHNLNVSNVQVICNMLLPFWNDKSTTYLCMDHVD